MVRSGPESADRAERREQWRYLALLLPALITLAAFFVYPLLGILFRSVHKNEYTLDFYRQVFRTGVYVTVIGLTFRTAAIVTLICLLIGYPLAYVLATIRPRLARFLIIIVVLPFFTSIIVRTYAWMVLLGRNGIVNQYLTALGLVPAPLPLLYNQGGVIIGMVHWAEGLHVREFSDQLRWFARDVMPAFTKRA